MGEDATPEAHVAEVAGVDVAALVNGEFVGDVDGLVWEDASGCDIVSITFRGDHVVVPVNHGEWRTSHVVLDFDIEQVALAPRLLDLQAGGGDGAVGLVGTYFDLNLTGPPPGPDPQPLPPWWRRDKA